MRAAMQNKAKQCPESPDFVEQKSMARAGRMLVLVN